jgi:hypothetical protein
MSVVADTLIPLAITSSCSEHLPTAQITFDKCDVVWHAKVVVDNMCRIEQPSDKSHKGMRRKLLKDRSGLDFRERPIGSADR